MAAPASTVRMDSSGTEDSASLVAITAGFGMPHPPPASAKTEETGMAMHALFVREARCGTPLLIYAPAIAAAAGTESPVSPVLEAKPGIPKAWPAHALQTHSGMGRPASLVPQVNLGVLQRAAVPVPVGPTGTEVPA